ncbi:MAG: hypothetical protein QME81_01385, partial [bacterium]|nr:hypothetical protein [bacterium]
MKARLAVIFLIVLGIIISFTEVSEAVPLPPTNLAVANEGGPISLTWTETLGMGIITYEIYRDTTSTVDTGSVLVGTTDESDTDYTDTTTVDGTTYYYAV